MAPPGGYYQPPSFQPGPPLPDKIPFSVWKYTLVRLLLSLNSVATLIMFLVVQLKYPGFFMGSVVYVALAVFNLVFLCLPHKSKLHLMRNWVFLIVQDLLANAILIWNIVNNVKTVSMCGAPYYYCSLDLRTTLPQLGWAQFAVFLSQQCLFIVYFVMYKKDQDKLGKEGVPLVVETAYAGQR